MRCINILICGLVMQIVNSQETCLGEWEKIVRSAIDHDLPKQYSEMLMYSGITLNNLGNFDSCNNLDSAKYTLVAYSLVPLIVQTFCGPKICTKSDYKNFSLAIGSDFDVHFVREYQLENYQHFTKGPIIMIVIIFLLLLVVILASGCEFYYKKRNPEELLWKPMQILTSFSVITNFSKLFKARNNDQINAFINLDFLDGVRSLSLFWVVLGHVVSTYASYAVLSNFDTEFELVKDPKYIIVLGGFYAVDTFFWISGFLVAYFFLIKFEKSADFSLETLGLFYFHRYLRITPVLMFCVFFNWTFLVYLGSGPLWIYIETIVGQCKDYWYSNLFYLNNFVPDWNGNDCYGVAWYLAVDMQLFLASPLILYVYSRRSKPLGWLLIFLTIIASITVTGIIALIYNLNPVILSTRNEKYMSNYYIKPYTRAAPYVLGIACGLITFTYKKYKENGEVYDKYCVIVGKLIENFYFRVVIFCFGLGLVNFMIFILYDSYKYPGENFDFPHWTLISNYLFLSVQRFAYGMGISLIFLPLCLGFFPRVSSFLSVYPFTILARFSFVIYLVHASVIGTAIKSQTNVLMLNWYNSIRDTCYFLFLSFIIAIPIILFIEMPITTIEKSIIGQDNQSNLENSKITFTEELKDFSKN